MIPACALLLLRVMSSAEINARQHDSRGADLRLEKEGREVEKIYGETICPRGLSDSWGLAKRFEPIFPSQDRRSPPLLFGPLYPFTCNYLCRSSPEFHSKKDGSHLDFVDHSIHVGDPLSNKLSSNLALEND
jgi:hypothetical protein